MRRAKFRRRLNIPVSDELYHQVEKQAYNASRSMADICRRILTRAIMDQYDGNKEAVDAIIKEAERIFASK